MSYSNSISNGNSISNSNGNNISNGNSSRTKDLRVRLTDYLMRCYRHYDIHTKFPAIKLKYFDVNIVIYREENHYSIHFYSKSIVSITSPRNYLSLSSTSPWANSSYSCIYNRNTTRLLKYKNKIIDKCLYNIEQLENAIEFLQSKFINVDKEVYFSYGDSLELQHYYEIKILDSKPVIRIHTDKNTRDNPDAVLSAVRRCFLLANTNKGLLYKYRTLSRDEQFFINNLYRIKYIKVRDMHIGIIKYIGSTLEFYNLDTGEQIDSLSDIIKDILVKLSI